MSRFAIASTIALLATFAVHGAEVADGIYPIVSNTGRDIQLSGGDWVALGKLRTATWERAEVRSLTNDNSRFEVRLINVDKAVENGDPANIVLAVNAVGMPFHSRVEHADGKLDLSFTLTGADESRTIAGVLKTEPVLRKHPGHRVVLKLTPAKETYHPGEPVTLAVDISNVGDVPVLFRDGGRQRGARNNQFRFLAYAGGGQGKAVHDTGDPTHFGGLSTLRPLKPGESVHHTIPLDKWFAFTEPGSYRITGLFELELHDMPRRELHQVIWDELAVGECTIKITAPGKKP
jgi:hypothetical protein